MAQSSKRARFEADVLDSTICSICKGTLDDPRILPCFHTYCRRCIQRSMDKYTERYPCRICKKWHDIPPRGAKGLKVNIFTDSILGVLECYDKEDHCEVCDKRSKFMCIDCKEKLCKKCEQTHKLSRSTSKHPVVELTGDRACDIQTITDVLSQGTLFCHKHPQERLKYYCENDKIVICEKCDQDHLGHLHTDIKYMRHTNTDTLNEAIDLGKDRSDECANNIDNIYTRIDTIKHDIENSKIKLDAEKRNIHIKVNAYFTELHSELQLVGDSATEKEESNLSILNSKKNVIDASVNQLELLKEYGHVIDIAHMIAEIENKTQAWSAPLNIDLKPVANVAVTSGKINDDNVSFPKLKKEYTPLDNSSFNVLRPKLKRRRQESQSSTSVHTTVLHSRSKLDIQKHKIVHQFSDMCVSKNDDIVTFDRDKIRIYDKTLKHTRILNLFHSWGMSPTTTEDNCLIICYENAKCAALHVYNEDGAYEGQIKIPSIKNLQDIAINHQNKLIIVTKNDEICVCDYTGPLTRIRSFDIDVSTCELPNKCTVAINSNDVVLLSGQGYVKAIQIVDGRMRKQLWKHSPNNCKDDIFKACIDSKDNIILYNAGKQTIKLCTPDCHFIKNLLTPSRGDCQIVDIAVNSNDELVVGGYHEGSDTKTCIFTVKYNDAPVPNMRTSLKRPIHSSL